MLSIWSDLFKGTSTGKALDYRAIKRLISVDATLDVCDDDLTMGADLKSTKMSSNAAIASETPSTRKFFSNYKSKTLAHLHDIERKILSAEE